MGVPIGKVVYRIGNAPCSGVGLTWTQMELDLAMQGPILQVLFDEEGKSQLEELLTGLAETEFALEGVRQVLKMPARIDDWRVGEAVAESYLTEHRACMFPWPVSRDERIWGSSLPGADLIGFGRDDKGACLAFGEVKTSYEKKYPPSIMFGRTGFKKQLEHLRDQESVRDGLLAYLSFRAQNTDWFPLFEEAGRRYLQDKSDVQIYGFLIRDVGPNESDLRARVRSLDKNRPHETVIQLLALYLPPQNILRLGGAAAQEGIRGGA